jgi:protein-tyrosine phosphatase
LPGNGRLKNPALDGILAALNKHFRKEGQSMDASKNTVLSVIDAWEKEYLENTVAKGMLLALVPNWENQFRQVLALPEFDEIRQYFSQLRKSIEAGHDADAQLLEALSHLRSPEKLD